MAFDWRALVGTVAPTIATALGGPVAGLAVKALSNAVLGRDDGDEQEISAALQGASPETLAAIKKADQDFAVRMKELDIDVYRLDQQDRVSARDREIRTGDSWTPRLLAAGVTAGFFGVLWHLMANGIVDDAGGNALLIMLGSLGTAWTGIVAYYFGSSAGSKAKTDIMAKGPGGR
jgi:hypothetical protein